MKPLLLCTAALFTAAMAFSQYGQIEQPRMFRANITGQRGDEGKCTIEVNIDDIAVVEVFGDQGRLITLSGQPSEWRRMVCTAPMPGNPVDFRFRGIDGRGRQILERDPRENRGVAVVRLEDPKGGREGYTFDLEWRGAAAMQPYAPAPPVQPYPPAQVYPPNAPPPPPVGDRDREGGRHEHPDNHPNTILLTCESEGRGRRYCEADTRGGVLLMRQRGDRECRQGFSWGFDNRGVWVDRGCRADFEVLRPR